MTKSTIRHEVSASPVKALRVQVVEGPDQGLKRLATSETITVGTSKDNDLVLTDETVSRYHLELRHLGEQILVEDLGSTNGTLVGKVLVGRGKLLPGASLQLGKTKLRVHDDAPLKIELHGSDEFCGIKGRSAEMRRLMAHIERIGKSEASILLAGETGSGKEVVARAIHEASPRAGKSIETVDCGALAPTLIASELFGHERGAFTGADRRYIGAFERAQGGTLFLDEIGELPGSLQTTLLGAIERRAFRRVGGDKPLSVDVRLVCATNRDLRAEVNAGTFRDDLYYRIAVVRLDIPSLRERRDDIPFLATHFLRAAGYDGTVEDVLSQKVLDTMSEYRWPGNVRELRNFVDAALALGEVPTLSSHTEGDPGAFPSVPLPDLLDMDFKDARSLVLGEFERRYVGHLLDRSAGNVSEGARIAKIHRTYLIQMLKRHKIR